jgi:hypothetical protein
MSKWEKLYGDLLRNPDRRIRFSELDGLHRAFGFAAKSGKGDHMNYKHPAVAVVLTAQPRGKDAVQYQVKRLLAVIKEYDLHISG